MVDEEGTLKILDFGIARVAESGLTASGVAIGTVNYMSPEQVAGEAVDYRSDVFSVGAVFHELLTYEPAFPGTIQDGVLYRIVHGEPAALREACPDLDPAIEEAVKQAMCAKADERYQDLEVMADQLEVIRRRLGPDIDLPATPPADLETALTPAPGSIRRAASPTPTRPPTRQPPDHTSAGAGPPPQTAAPATGGTLTSHATREAAVSHRRLWWIAGIGAAAALVAAGAVLSPGLSGPPDAVDPGPPSASALIPGPEPTAPGRRAVPPTTAPIAAPTDLTEPPAGSPATAAAASEPLNDRPSAPTPTRDAGRPAPSATDRLAELRQQAVTAFIQGDREASLSAAAAVLQLVPEDAEAEQVLDRLHRDALEEAQRARQSIDDRGDDATSPLYQQARQAESDAQDLVQAGQRESAIRRLWTATGLFGQAAPAVERDLTPRLAGGPPAPVETDRSSGVGDAVSPSVEVSTEPTAPPGPAAPSAGDDLEAIDGTLGRYRAALEQLDGVALERVYPSVPRDTIAALGDYNAYVVSMNDVNTRVDGDVATVNSQLSLTITARTGITAQASGPAVFQLRNQGAGDWVITRIDMSQVR